VWKWERSRGSGLAGGAKAFGGGEDVGIDEPFQLFDGDAQRLQGCGGGVDRRVFGWLGLW